MDSTRRVLVRRAIANTSDSLRCGRRDTTQNYKLFIDVQDRVLVARVNCDGKIRTKKEGEEWAGSNEKEKLAGFAASLTTFWRWRWGLFSFFSTFFTLFTLSAFFEVR